MASSQVINLTAKTSIATTDVMPIQATTGDLKKITGSNIKASLESGGGIALTLASSQISLSGIDDTHVIYNNSGTMDGDDDLTWNDSTNVLQIGASTATARILLPLSNDAVTPTLGFGNGDSGFYESADDTIGIAIAGSNVGSIDATGIYTANASGAQLLNEAASTTNPTVAPDRADLDTGIGQGSADTMSLIAGGVEMVRLVESTTDSVCFRTDDAAVTDADIPTSFVAFYLDEGNNKLMFRARYSDDSLATGELALT